MQELACDHANKHGTMKGCYHTVWHGKGSYQEKCVHANSCGDYQRQLEKEKITLLEKIEEVEREMKLDSVAKPGPVYLGRPINPEPTKEAEGSTCELAKKQGTEKGCYTTIWRGHYSNRKRCVHATKCIGYHRQLEREKAEMPNPFRVFSQTDNATVPYLKHLKANWRVASHALYDFIAHFIHGLIPAITIKHQEPKGE